MYIVTGAAGFIGSNIIKGLNDNGITNIIAVDDLTDGNKFKNISKAKISYYLDKDEFIKLVIGYKFPWKNIDYLIHQGACSDTMNHDGKFMMNNNYQYSMDLLEWCLNKSIPMIYASSAAVYGLNNDSTEDTNNESPLNVYGYSKYLFDEYVRYIIANKLKAPIVGLRYFNVYGMQEQHKGKMASIIYHSYYKFKKLGYVELFGKYNNIEAGEQKRDFIFINDIVNINLFFIKNTNIKNSGIYNVGLGKASTYNNFMFNLINSIRRQNNEKEISFEDMLKDKLIRYIDFPDNLKGKYQSYTQANITKLSKIYHNKFTTIKDGIDEYVNYLSSI